MAIWRARRKITAAALMVGLLVVYFVSAPAAWATLAGFLVAWLLAQPRASGQGLRTADQRVETPVPSAAVERRVSLRREPPSCAAVR